MIKYLINVHFTCTSLKIYPKHRFFSVYWLGALAFDKHTGFWMISSIPRFPAKQRDGYNFLYEQTRYGQMVLCVTVPLSAKKRIGNAILLRKTKII